MSNLTLFILMVLGGACVAIQPSINARLAQKIGLVESATVSFLVGSAALLVLALIAGRGDFRSLSQARSWELTGGLYGAFFVTMTILAVPRIGTTATLALTIAAQLTAGLLMDHYGVLGMRGIPLDFRRLLGVALLLLGTALILKR